MNQETISQMVLDNAEAISQGVGRVCAMANLGNDIHADLVGDVRLAILNTRGKSFDADRGNAAVFCRMVAFQVALDKLRAMNRGGQFSGAYAGFGNADLDNNSLAGDNGDNPQNFAPAQNTHQPKEGAANTQDNTGRAVRVRGQALDLLGPDSFVAEVADRQWLTQARAAVAEVLPSLTESDRELWTILADGSFDPSAYAATQGISTATAYVRANRLRAKVRDLLAIAA